MHLENIVTEQLRIHDWQINPHQCWAVIGRNGSGKQLLANLISSETPLDQGQMSHDFHNIVVLSFEQQQCLYEQELRQDDSDFMDRLDNGSTVRELLDIAGEIPEQLSFLGLDRIMDRGYRLLSSGESRKALLAQAILRKPDFLILDEPYDSLDLQSRDELQQFFAFLLGHHQAQLLFLINNIDEISPWHTHLALMEKGELIAQGRQEEILADSAITSLLSFNPEQLPAWPEDLPRPPLADPLLDLNEGNVKYGDLTIFESINLKVNQGDHTLLTGANGSGKSTLLNLFTGDHPQCYGNDLKVLGFQRGSGESIWEVKKKIGIVTPGLHRDHRVAGTALHITLSGFFDTIGLYDEPSDSQISHARQWLALVGMQENSGKPYKHLSYGEQRLVLIARALVKQPALLILDEPTQGLDEVNRHRVMFFLEHLSSQQRTTIIMASHRLDERLPLFSHHLAL